MELKRAQEAAQRQKERADYAVAIESNNAKVDKELQRRAEVKAQYMKASGNALHAQLTEAEKQRAADLRKQKEDEARERQRLEAIVKEAEAAEMRKMQEKRDKLKQMTA